MIEAIDQKAAFLVDREIEGAARPLHAVLPEPALRGVEQRVENRLIVLGVEQAEMAGVVAVALEVQPIDLRADPPDRPSVPKGQPVPAVRMPVIGVLLRVQGLVALDGERRHVAGSPAIEPVRQIDERRKVGAPGHRPDVEGAARRALGHDAACMDRTDLGSDGHRRQDRRRGNLEGERPGGKAPAARRPGVSDRSRHQR